MTQTIADWLETLQLGQYTDLFVENGIDLSVLPDLTDQDFEKLGVVLGHRRKLLRAIINLTAIENRTPAAAPAIEPPRSSDSAERRQVTVMFSDLVGSTALSARMDPEDLRGIIGAYHRRCTELLEQNGGFIAKYMGDGVLAYFGYPQAHEHDAERAVRGALALVEAVPKLMTAAGSPLTVRVGIATGLVVVGDLIGSGESQERGIVGKTPNLAARLQAIAEPGTVVIDDSMRNLLGNLFELTDLGPWDLKGIGLARAWAALRASSVESRFEALHASSLTAHVGREEESELLYRRWSKARTSEGQVVLLSGEAGIGKSRLTAALLERLATEPHTRLRYFCSPQHTDSALYPIISQMERAAGLVHDDKLPSKLDKLDAVFAQTSTSREDAALFAEMLSLPNDGRYPVLELAPQQRRQKTLDALTAQVTALATQQPVLMIFEDMHWTDPTSLEALSRIIDGIKTRPVLLVVTFRPEFNAPWVGQSHVTSLTLNRLGEREATTIIAGLAGSKQLPPDVMAEIVERTDGIPLFVEEMTKAVLEAKNEGVARRLVAAAPSSALVVPASLHASLMARLDRLGGPAKEVAQVGSAIGREFSHVILAAAVRMPEAELLAALGPLIATGLLFRQGVPPHATYLFKHALVQDAAYGTLLREPRRALHARIAEALETQFPEIVESRPELLARHWTEAGLIEKAAGLWGKAGQRSLARSAPLEAAAQLARALSQIEALPESTILRREQIKFQVDLANALMHWKGFAAPETKAALDRAQLYIERARARGEPPEDPLLLFSVLYGFCIASYVAFNGDLMRELAGHFLALAEKEGAAVPLMIGHRLMGMSLMFTGDIAEGRGHLDQAIALYDPIEHGPLATRFGQDVEVAVLSWRSLALWILGYPEAAQADANRALQHAREIGQPATLMYALSITSWTLVYCGDYSAASAQADEADALANEKGALFWRAPTMMIQGALMALTGNASSAVRLITAGIAAWRTTGATLLLPWYLSCLAVAYAKINQFDEAWRCIDEAMRMTETKKERWCEPDIHQMAGEIALMSPEPDPAKAEAYFEHALAVAREQKAKSWELRAAMSMARLRCDQGKPQEVHDLLAPVYDWFTEGFDTSDLKEAKALLAKLPSRPGPLPSCTGSPAP
jgi:class 3 adenylate cyclase/predicted ATPase